MLTINLSILLLNDGGESGKRAVHDTKFMLVEWHSIVCGTSESRNRVLMRRSHHVRRGMLQ